MKLIPASMAAWMILTESSWSGFPHSPNIIAPRQSGLTFIPVRPRVRYFMGDLRPDRAPPSRTRHVYRAKHAATDLGRVVGTRRSSPPSPARPTRGKVGQPGEEELTLGVVVGQLE